ncbi:MAG: hypothetical protein COA93_01270 [Alphaproteobacteria bacterium]|nr:MAG: hypothetical protein COA93_01270 [Alphaproteobacteria bacterium]
MRLKVLASAVLVLILGYVFFWHYMAGEIEEKFGHWASQQKSKGISVNYKDLEISGFPYRMQLSLNDLRIVKTGPEKPPISVISPHVMLVAFPWNINHGVIFSDGATVRIGSRRNPTLSLNIGKTRASANIDILNRRFQRASFVMEDVSWGGGKSVKRSSAKEVKFHIMRPESLKVPVPSNDMELPILMKIYLEASDVVAQEIPVGIFGKKADQIKIDLQFHGEKIPDFSKESLGAWRDAGGTVDVKNISVLSGEMDLILDGEATLDQDLKPLGAFAAKIHGIDHIVTILSGHSAFQQEPGAMILQELRRMSKQDGARENQRKDTLDLAISLQGGLLFLGPIPVYELGPVVE